MAKKGQLENRSAEREKNQKGRRTPKHCQVRGATLKKEVARIEMPRVSTSTHGFKRFSASPLGNEGGKAKNCRGPKKSANESSAGLDSTINYTLND